MMSKDYLWKASNVFELFGLDFMLDDDLKVWFLECNSSPRLYFDTPDFVTRMITDLMEI